MGLIFFVGRIVGRRRRGLDSWVGELDVVGKIVGGIVGGTVGTVETIGAIVGGVIEGGVKEGKPEEGNTDLGFKVFAAQSIAGLTRSRKGIPRITACAPIGATKKVS